MSKRTDGEQVDSSQLDQLTIDSKDEPMTFETIPSSLPQGVAND
jgi:hypothetical protein